MAQILEVVMLLCFGASWPFSVIKSYRARSTKGKSLLFLVLVGSGYVIGLIGKILYTPGYVIIVYALNTCLVFADIFLYFRNKRLEAASRAARPAMEN